MQENTTKVSSGDGRSRDERRVTFSEFSGIKKAADQADFDSLSNDNLKDSKSNEPINFLKKYPSYYTSMLGAESSDSPLGQVDPFDTEDNDSVLSQGETIDFLKDKPLEMTGSRRLALSLLDKKWYNPHAGKGEVDMKASFDGSPGEKTPSLQRAWAYFEHATLMRYCNTGINRNWFEMTRWQRFRYATTNADEEFERAKPGEKMRPTTLYDWLATPHMQLGDFGLGFGLYFSTLRAIAYILFISGLISIFNISFFHSDQYGDSGKNPGFEYKGASGFLIRGSAVCTEVEWVPCIDCFCNDTQQRWSSSRCFSTNETLDGDFFSPNITFALKNRCLKDDNGILRLGLVNYGVMIFLLPAIYIFLQFYLEKQVVKFDIEQSAQDYSISINLPPPEATNPRKWRNYFEQTFPGVEVVAVTCNVDNDLLVKALVKRREILRRMEVYLEDGTDMNIDNLALMAAQEAKNRGKYLDAIKVWFVPGLPELLSSLVTLNTRIKGLSQLDYPCTNVFISFEKESHQRRVLSKLSIGKKYIRNNNAAGLEHPKYMFEGTVLNVAKASEPNAIRWEDLNFQSSTRRNRSIITYVITMGCIFIGATFVSFAEEASPGFGAAFAISALNLCFPELAKYITDFEGHPHESKLQTSLYIKIAAFRWVNTAIVTTYITPFTNTLLPGGLLNQIAAIFFAEIVTTNVIQLTDVWGHIKRHVLAPRAKTQDAMNCFFQGLEVELAERYTNMTKIMFLAFWYSSIFPAGLILASVALAVNYYTDRFSLMRSWQRSPRVGTSISYISLNYFFSLALFFLAVMSSFYWSAFPFDNLCPVEDQVPEKYFGNYNVTTITNTRTFPVTESINSSTSAYHFCNQDFLTRGKIPLISNFPFIYREDDPAFGEWMSSDQQFLSKLFGWTSIGFIVLVGLKFLYGFYCQVKLQFVSNYKPSLEKGIDFHEVATIAGYVPQVKSNLFSYPLIVCDCDKLGDELFDWADPDQDYGYYDLTKDADHILTGSHRRAENSFDCVKYWPPKALNGNLARMNSKRKLNISRPSLFNGGISVDPNAFNSERSSNLTQVSC